MLKKRLIPKLLIETKKIGEEQIAILVTTKGYQKKIISHLTQELWLKLQGTNV